MKFGGKLWNGSTNHKQGVQTRYKCRYCGRDYKMEWAKENHSKLCKEHFEI